MKRLISVFLILAVLLSFQGGFASCSFQNDYEGIDQAAKSVLMLLVYSAGGNDHDTTGSGFVAFDNQTLITNYHVIEGGDLVLAESDDGESFFLDQVIAADQEKDLAILKFKGSTTLTPLPLFSGSQLLRGQPVVAIGSPEGYKNTVSKGDISSFSTEDGVRLIHFTAPISHGSSGGALFNDQGEVIGITSSSLFGSSQNMNFAIDIAEAIQLYESAKGREPTALSALGASQEKTAEKGSEETREKNSFNVQNISVRQIAPDKAEVTWQSDEKPEKWFIGYEIEANPYYSYEETDGTTAVIENLVPGQEYLFCISDSLAGLDATKNSERLKLHDPLPYDKRGALLLDKGFYFIEKNHRIGMPLKPGLAQITTGQLYQALADMELNFVYRLKLEASQEPGKGACQYVVYLPSGKVYTQEHLYDFGTQRNSYLRKASLKDALSSMLEYEDGFELGTWRAAVYHDGALVAETTAEVVEDAGGASEREGGKGIGKPFSISSVKGSVYLNWAGLEAAESYDVYRSNTEDGHYFFVERTNHQHYLDEKVFSGRSYYYKIVYLNASNEQVSTDPLSVTIPPKNTAEGFVEKETANETPDIPLFVGEEAYVGTTDQPYLDPDIINKSEEKAVTGFTLAYYATDWDYRVLKFADTGKEISYYSFKTLVKPGELINPGKVSMKSYGPGVARIYAAISSVTMEDGRVIKVPEEDLDFFSWELN
ncbi:MAG: trypsin-like peptidase domain-containing protein [Bacillota bacterium]|nr:trypsin-like peptidase domain-containing protein [Bacillota bacterium]